MFCKANTVPGYTSEALYRRRPVENFNIINRMLLLARRLLQTPRGGAGLFEQ